MAGPKQRLGFGVPALLRELFFQQLDVETDRRERISYLVRDVRGHFSDRRQPLVGDGLTLGLCDRAHHLFERCRQFAELVVRGGDVPRGEIPAGNGARTLGDLRQRRQEPSCLQRDHHAHAEGQDREQHEGVDRLPLAFACLRREGFHRCCEAVGDDVEAPVAIVFDGSEGDEHAVDGVLVPRLDGRKKSIEIDLVGGQQRFDRRQLLCKIARKLQRGRAAYRVELRKGGSCVENFRAARRREGAEQHPRADRIALVGNSVDER